MVIGGPNRDHDASLASTDQHERQSLHCPRPSKGKQAWTDRESAGRRSAEIRQIQELCRIYTIIDDAIRHLRRAAPRILRGPPGADRTLKPASLTGFRSEAAERAGAARLATLREGTTERNAADTVLSDDAVDSR
jgi:hypothetical protein